MHQGRVRPGMLHCSCDFEVAVEKTEERPLNNSSGVRKWVPLGLEHGSQPFVKHTPNVFCSTAARSLDVWDDAQSHKDGSDSSNHVFHQGLWIGSWIIKCHKAVLLRQREHPVFQGHEVCVLVEYFGELVGATSLDCFVGQEIHQRFWQCPCEVNVHGIVQIVFRILHDPHHVLVGRFDEVHGRRVCDALSFRVDHEVQGDPVLS
mmetsp:Transcript_2452/g.16414  ORF Transcript_2452/g.16414 Transcript_2452/m.16414 type:complete len:205 (+) Transcript_2452:1465-2079(+)